MRIMYVTPLQEALRHHGKDQEMPAAEYRGATTAARFKNAREEFSALQSGCAIYDAGFRVPLLLKGGDRVRWMNGMVTNNIRDLAVGRGVYAFLLNAQGRILGDMHIYNMGETLEVVTDRAQAEKIAATFDRFIIMDDVEVTNLGESWTTLGVAGPQALALLNAAGIEVPELQPLQFTRPKCNCDCGCVSCTVTRGEDGLPESYEIWLAPKDVYNTWTALIAAGATPVGSETIERMRIASGVPLYGVDIRERDLPQETGQTRALNFNKGCYVGQEIVERIRSRGNVHRMFSGFAVDSAEVAGAKIMSGEKEAGEITSVASIPVAAGERNIALGYIRREAALPGRDLTVNGAAVRLIELPLAEIAAARQDRPVLHTV